MPQEKNNTFTKWLKNKRFIAIAAIVIVLISIFLFARGDDKGALEQVARRDLKQVVRITGKVSPSLDATLAFERTGKIAYVGTDVGARVVAGQLLMAQDASDVEAEIAQYKATVKAEEAKLAQLDRGSTAEEIAVYETKFSNAVIAVENAKKNVIDTIASTFTEVDDAIRGKIDPLFLNPNSSNPDFNLSVDGQLVSVIERGRVTMESILKDWPDASGLVLPYSAEAVSSAAELNNPGAATSVLAIEAAYLSKLSSTKTHLMTVRTFVDAIARALNTVIASSQISQSAIDTYKASVLTARNNVNASIASIASAEESLRNAIAAAGLARSELALTKTPARIEEVEAQKARIDQANANVKNAEARLAKARLYAPLDGVVTEKNFERGEIVSANATVIKVIATDAYKIEANIPESEISNVKIGNKTSITLDAYPEDSIGGTVALIDPAELLVDGVPTYKVTIRIDPSTVVVRSGMTANIRIITTEVAAALSVPYGMLTFRDGTAYVTVVDKDGNNPVEVKVTTGLRDDNGFVEILDGVKEGDFILPIEVK